MKSRQMYDFSKFSFVVEGKNKIVQRESMKKTKTIKVSCWEDLWQSEMFYILNIHLEIMYILMIIKEIVTCFHIESGVMIFFKHNANLKPLIRFASSLCTFILVKFSLLYTFIFSSTFILPESNSSTSNSTQKLVNKSKVNFWWQCKM